MRSTLLKQRARAGQFNATAYLNGSVYTLTLSRISAGPYSTLCVTNTRLQVCYYTYMFYTEDISHFYFRSISYITVLKYPIL